LPPKARILAIDDQLYFRSFVEGLLSEAGYAVRAVESDARAIDAAARDGAPDVLIADLGQRPDAAAALERVRARWPKAALLALSASADPGARAIALRAGARDFMQKPVDREALLRAVAALVAPPRNDTEQGRLLDENVELMSRVSLLERTTALFEPRARAEVEKRLAELLQVDTRAREVSLFAEARADGSLARSLVLGGSSGSTPELLPTDPPARVDALRAGRIVPEPDPTKPAFLWVPFKREDRLVAVARLAASEAGTFGAREIDACTRIAGPAAIALDAAQDRERLACSSFREPATGLPGREFLDEVGRTEVHKAHRFGRRLSLLCVDVEGFDPDRNAAVLPSLVGAVTRTLRTTDVLVAERARRFWVLVTDTDPLGGVVLKRRIAQRLRDALREARLAATPALGVANFPVDGESLEQLSAAAERRVQEEHASVVRELGIEAETPLSAMGARLLDRALWLPSDFVGEAAELLIGDLACRPRDRGLLFLAPGPDRKRFLAPLTALGDIETATEVFLATDGDTVPSGPAVTALSLPPNVSADTSWIVRFGEGPPYALVAGKPRSDGARPVFHSADPVLVEHMTFRLRAETGFGVRAG
jgi:CheY-like chemotaxis protein/GGDEF domain-containing protein